MTAIQHYIADNREKILEELSALLSIPSVSSDPRKKTHMKHAADFLRIKLLEYGADKAALLPTRGFPVVYAEKIIHSDLPTVLVYGHYDVMPAEPVELWASDPFKPVIRENRIYARGADDNKGQLFTHLKAFEYLTRNNLHRCNIKFIIEGEEEIGSPSLSGFLRKNKDLLKSDIIVVSDTKMAGPDLPSVTIGLRGLCYAEIEVKGPDRDLHSGHYGGVIANPVHALCSVIASFFDQQQRIIIPGFYDQVQALSETEKNELSRITVSVDDFKASTGVHDLTGEDGFTIPERVGARPALDVNAIWAGHIGEGSKTIIPSTAHAKITIRLVPDQSPDNIHDILKKHISALKIKGVTVELKNFYGSKGYSSSVESKAYLSAISALKKAFGVDPVPTRSGGSIPIISDFEQILGLKTILMGFGLDSDRIHSPNENFSLNNLFRGIESVVYFYDEYCREGRVAR